MRFHLSIDAATYPLVVADLVGLTGRGARQNRLLSLAAAALLMERTCLSHPIAILPTAAVAAPGPTALLPGSTPEPNYDPRTAAAIFDAFGGAPPDPL